MVSEGIANPTPCEPLAVAVVIPTTIPPAFKSGPPEFPGFIGALNWITSDIESTWLVDWYWIFLPNWLTIPIVMEPESPKGFPIAVTVCPTLRDDDGASASGWKSLSEAGVTITAISL
jgi:hypothetical protein